MSLRNTNEKENIVIKDNRSNSRMEICVLLAAVDKCSSEVLNSHCCTYKQKE